jgi:RNA polymerase sigma-70 factor, ECF subfamily
MFNNHCAPRVPASTLDAPAKLCSRSSPSGKTKRLSCEKGASHGMKREQKQKRLPKSPSSSPDQMIRLAQQGDARAFEHIYRLHSPRVYALCVRLAHDPVEAEDFTQEVFLQLFRKIHTFRGESAFSSWLYRLTANLVFMRFRKKKLAISSLENSVETENERAAIGLEIGFIDPRLNGLFDRMNLQAAIDRLPEGYKRMFILHDVHGYGHNEIAKIFECSVGNSKSQLHKARKRLREVLRGLDVTPNHSRLVRRKDQNRVTTQPVVLGALSL